MITIEQLKKAIAERGGDIAAYINGDCIHDSDFNVDFIADALKVIRKHGYAKLYLYGHTISGVSGDYTIKVETALQDGWTRRWHGSIFERQLKYISLTSPKEDIELMI